MKKIKTLFKRTFNEKHEVTIYNEVTPGYEWVLNGEGVPTLKIDGTAVLIQGGNLYVRYDTWLGNKGKSKKDRKGAGKPFREVPEGSINCMEEPDTITGSFPVWAPIESVDTAATFKPYLQVWQGLLEVPEDGTYELCGPHFQSNPGKLEEDMFIKHGSIILTSVPRDFDGIREYLHENYIEGIVFHRGNGEMCKIKRTDFGFEWNGSEIRKGRK